MDHVKDQVAELTHQEEDRDEVQTIAALVKPPAALISILDCWIFPRPQLHHQFDIQLATLVEDLENDLLNVLLAVQLNLLLEAAHEVDLLQSKNVL